MVYFHGIDVSEKIHVNKIIIKEANPNSAIFVTIDIFYIKGSNYCCIIILAELANMRP